MSTVGLIVQLKLERKECNKCSVGDICVLIITIDLALLPQFLCFVFYLLVKYYGLALCNNMNKCSK